MRLEARGLGASPGEASGPLATSPEAALAFAERGTPAILVRIETSAEDLPAIRACAGLVITRGGLTADGAIAARALGKPCVTGVGSVRVLYTERRIMFGTEKGPAFVEEGEQVIVDAGQGMLAAQ